MVLVRSARALEFACHSKNCAPPPAGKGGSSKGHGTHIGSLSRKTQKKFGIPKQPKAVRKMHKRDNKLAHKVMAYAFAASSFEFACHSKACAPPSAGGTGGSIGKGGGAGGSEFPGTPGWKPRSMSQAEARAEIDSDIRDSENHGYNMDEAEARDFLMAFNRMRNTGKAASYGDPRYGQQTVEPGDTTYFAKLDYEVSFQADAVAAYFGQPLKATRAPAAAPRTSQGTIVPVKPQGDLGAATRQAKAINTVKSMIRSNPPVSPAVTGKVATSQGRVTVDGKRITNKAVNHGSGKGWSAKLTAANGGGLAEGRTRAELAFNAAHMAKAHQALK